MEVQMKKYIARVLATLIILVAILPLDRMTAYADTSENSWSYTEETNTINVTCTIPTGITLGDSVPFTISYDGNDATGNIIGVGAVWGCPNSEGFLYKGTKWHNARKISSSFVANQRYGYIIVGYYSSGHSLEQFPKFVINGIEYQSVHSAETEFFVVADLGSTNNDGGLSGGDFDTTPEETRNNEEVSTSPSSGKDNTEIKPVDVMAEREALEKTLPISPVTIDTTQFKQADAAIVPGTAYNLSNFTTTSGIVRGINAAVEGANKTGANEATIYSGNPLCFNNAIIKAINDGKKDIVYYFTYKGHVYSVTVPATVDAKKVLDKAPFAGPFYVGQQLGTTKLIK